MTFLPIVSRELRVAARRRATFWTRTAVALGACGIGVFLYLASLDVAAEVVAQRIFTGLLVLAIFFCVFAGRRSTADCLSEEKREGTLGLLFLTDLKGYDVVMGKLAATSVNGFYCLLAVFPILAVPLLIGGITNGQFWRVVLVLCNTFLFSLSVGIFVSAFSKDARRAMGANLLLLLAIIAVPGGCAAVLAFVLPSNHFYPELLLTCPFYSLYLSDDSVYRFNRTYFWGSLALLHALTWGLLSLASWSVRHSWQDRPAGPKALTWRERWRSWTLGPITRRASYRARLLDVNPFFWLAARSRSKPLQVWCVLMFIGLWWVWARYQLGTLWLDDAVGGTDIAAAIMLNVALKTWIALESSRQLAEERRSGSFELLLSTPLTPREILQGQFLALRRQFLLPSVASIAVAAIFMSLAFQHAQLDGGLLLTTWLGAMIMFVIDVFALVWTAMYCALTARGPHQAAAMTISRIILAPSLVLIAIAVLTSVYSGQPAFGLRFFLLVWISLGLMADLGYGLSSRRHLLIRFRQLAGFGRPKKVA